MTPNLVNTEEIATYLDGFFPDNPKGADYLKCALRNCLRKGKASATQEGLPGWIEIAETLTDQEKATVAKFGQGPYHRFKPNDRLNSTVKHIADWIKGAMVSNDPWLLDRDERGRPKKLLKFGNLEQATQEADKAMRVKSEKQKAKMLVWDGKEEIAMRLAQGFTIVRLKTKDELKYEGSHMGHCIGDGGHDENLESNEYAYYSLRDSHNRPHTTFEVHLRSNNLLECRGKENKAPISRYMPHVIEFVESRRFGISSHDSTGLILQEGKYYSINHLPQGFQYNGSLDLEDTEEPTSLPDGLHVKGDLNLKNSAIIKLPNNLKVDGKLTIDGSAVEALGTNTYVGGTLSLNRKVELTEGLQVGGQLNAIGWRGKELPKGLRVEGDLLIQGSNILKLPNDLYVGGYTNLEGTVISEIPRGAFFGKGINFYDSSIKALPEGYVHNGDLNFDENTKIRELPNGLYVKGSLTLFESPINALPKRFRVDGDLVLWRPLEIAALGDTTVDEILEIFPGSNPRRLTNGNFDLGDTYGSKISKLPNDIVAEVGGDLYLPRNRFRELPKGLVVKGKIHGLAETPIPLVDGTSAQNLVPNRRNKSGRED